MRRSVIRGISNAAAPTFIPAPAASFPTVRNGSTNLLVRGVGPRGNLLPLFSPGSDAKHYKMDLIPRPPSRSSRRSCDTLEINRTNRPRRASVPEWEASILTDRAVKSDDGSESTRSSDSAGTVLPLDQNLKSPRHKRMREGRLRKHTKLMVSRKDFIIAKSIFDRYDTDGDGSISADEFVRALKQHAPLVEGADLFMKLDRNMTGVIGLVQWLHIYFPHVHMSECRRVVSKYLPKPRTPTPPSVKTLEDCPGAKEEIKAIFQHWDKQGNGNISLEDLQSPLVRCGISGTTALLWLNDGWEGS